MKNAEITLKTNGVKGAQSQRTQGEKHEEKVDGWKTNRGMRWNEEKTQWEKMRNGDDLEEI